MNIFKELATPIACLFIFLIFFFFYTQKVLQLISFDAVDLQWIVALIYLFPILHSVYIKVKEVYWFSSFVF